MSQLALIAVIVGLLLFVLSMVMILFPRQANTCVTRFPRSIWPGRILAAVDIIWITALFLYSDIRWVENHKLFVLIIAPVCFAIIVVLMDELLSVRAFGGLCLLAPYTILNAAFVYPSQSRLVMTVFAYLLVILGMILVWSPFMFSKMTSKWIGNTSLSQIVGFIGGAVGLIMVLLGLIVY